MTESYLSAQMNGLVTEPSRILAGQSGFIALDNATCKSPGLVEPRGGLLMYRNTQSVSANEPRTTYAQRWQGTTTFAATDGTNTKLRIGSASSVMTLTGANFDVRAEPFADRYVWTFANALRMLDEPTGGSAPFTRLPGAPRGPGFLATQANAAVATRSLQPLYGNSYRVVIARSITTSLGSRVVYGAPSDRVVIWNFTAGGVTWCDVTITIPTTTLSTGDEIQIYRSTLSVQWVSPGTATDPGDELQMIHSYKMLAPASTYTWTDTGGDGSWSGPPLYTNSSQEGALEANERTRIANDVAYYNGMAFYGGSSRGQSKTIACRSLNHNAPAAGTGLDVRNTLQSLLFACDTTIGTAVLTACNPVVATLILGGLSVGQLVNAAANDPEAAGTPKGKILSWNSGANTITLDTNSSASLAAVPCVAWDWVGIATGGTEQLIYAFPAGQTTFPWSNTSGVFAANNNVNASTLLRAFGASDMERAWAFKYTSTTNAVVPRLYTVADAVYPYGARVALRWEFDDSAGAPGDSVFTTPFEVVSTKPYAFSQQVGLTFAANICRSETDGGPSRVAWSKSLQPEATPLLNYVDLGDSAAPVVRLAASNDRLWIFKTDGLWSCYGDSPDALTFQQVDPTCRLTKNSGTPGLTSAVTTSPWVTRLGNRVFAWTNSGVFSVSSAGVQRVDSAIETDIRQWSPNYTGAIPGGGLWSAASVSDDLVVFGMANVQGVMPGNTTGITFAYHVGSGTWSTWSQKGTDNESLLTGSGNADTGAFVAGSAYGYASYMNSPRDDYFATAYPVPTTPAVIPFRCDVMTGTGMGVYTTDAVSGVTVAYKITGTAPNIVSGCIISQPGGNFMVLSVSGLTFTVDRAGVAAVTIFEVLFPITGTIRYAASTQGAPAIYKRFQRAYFGFQQLRGGLLFTDAYRIRGELTASAALTEYFPDTSTITTLPNAIGTTGDREFECMRDIPTAQTQGTGLEVTVTMQQAGMFYAIDALTVSYEPASQLLGGRS